MDGSTKQHQPHHLLSHAGIYLIARGLPGLIAFLAIPAFTRLLDPADYGRYALVLATANLLNALLFQWLRLSLVRYLPTYKDEPAKLKSTMLAANGVLVLAMGLVAGVLYCVPAMGIWHRMILPCWVLMVAQAAFEMCCEYSRSALQPWRYMMMQLLRATASVVLGVGLVLIGMRWAGPLTGLAMGMLLPVAWVYRHDWSDARWTIDPQTLKRIALYGLPLSLTVALTIVISTSDRFLIAGFMGEDAAGLYSVAVDFTSQTLTMLLMAVYMAAFPLAVRAFEHRGREAAQEQMKTNASLLMGIGIPCTIALIVLAPNMAHCLMGPKYRATAAHIIPLVAVGTFLAGMKACHFDTAFQFAHRTIYQVWIVLFAAVLNVGLNLVAIPKLGINGAAMASAIAYLISIGLTAWLGRRHFVLPFPVGSCVQVLLAGAVMGALLYPTRGYRGKVALSAQVIAGAIAYGAVLVSLNFLHLRDLIQRKWQARRGSDEAVAVSGAPAWRTT